MKRKFNLRPDTSDQRDLLWAKEMPKLKTIPTSVDLRKLMSKVEDQGDLGSCTANAFAGNLEYLYLKKSVMLDASRLFIYYNERVYINEVNEDSGANLRDGIKTLKTHGFCSENTWPYDISKFTKKPTAACYKEALPRKITKYLRIQTLDEINQALAQGIPVVFGIPVYESFVTNTVASTGKVPVPKANEEMLGGHALLVVGYKAGKKIVRNSWGASWGMKGYCEIPDAYMKQADDMWAVVD